MSTGLTVAQLTGRDDSGLLTLDGGQRLHPAAAEAFARLQRDAAVAGFGLAIASGYRSYERQRLIWNGKASGQRPVHDDRGNAVDVLHLDPVSRLHAILRFSALPGTSRHHWGTDLDIYDNRAVAADYPLQLSPQEVAPDGPFAPLHQWLDERMAAGESHGFFRPYGHDRGGVAAERWHLSYAPLAVACERGVTAAVLHECWDCDSGELLLRDQVEAQLPELLARYVAVDRDWCPARYHHSTPSDLS
ncbi:M15 family metallopeptidase [Kineobactrum salinum]|uniref:M15 family metallopeptidase n=1 Tax=Kineobactrum salinum TaxID=2708301 RepID=UPI001E3549B7|nr:M15 family metallopeptidase [Kineobactrum salinum]